MSLGGVGFYALTTEVAPGAGTKVGAHEVTLLDGSKVYFQAIVAGYLTPSGQFVPVDQANPLPVIIETESGDGLVFHASQPIGVAASETTIHSYVVPMLKQLQMKRITLSCNFECVGRLKVNGTEKRLIRVGPGSPTCSVEIDPVDAAAGDTVTVTYESRAGAPTSALVSASLDGRLIAQ